MYFYHLTVLPVLVISNAASTSAWCTFYQENTCQIRSGHVNYAEGNPNAFQNGGAYFKCHVEELSLISYPPGDSAGTRPKHCHVFSTYEANEECTHLDSLGFTTGDGGYYRLSTRKTCPATSSKREYEARWISNRPFARRYRSEDGDAGNSSHASDAEGDIEKRGGNWLTFYDDPDCTQRSGGVSYSTHNQGCFENGGAYASFNGDDHKWHLEQWTGINNYACAVKMQTCRNMNFFLDVNPSNGPPCIHLDSIGFHSGFGSYKIGRAGCP